MTRKQFISKVVNEALELRVTVKLVQQKSVSRLGGWFSGRELVCAMNNDYAFETLVHEYCHMLQWATNCRCWRKHCDDYDKFMQWKQGALHCSKRKLQQYAGSVIALEHDCERRAVQCIKQYDLNVDLNYYISTANVYLYSFHRVMQDKTSTVVFNAHNLQLVSDKFLPLKYYLADTNKMGTKISPNLCTRNS